MINLRSIKTRLILYLIFLAVFLSIKSGDPFFLGAVIIAFFSSLICESVIIYFRDRVFRITESSIITGLIVGFVLSSSLSWWVTAAASLSAIISKYLIRLKNKHIFNPAAFGVFFTVIIFDVSTQWRGTYLWLLLLPAGLYFTYKVRKSEVIIGYAVVFFGLYGYQALRESIPLWGILGYLSYFYIFVMVIEPRTTPLKPMGKYIFGSGIAALTYILNQLPGKLEVELVSLLIMNAAVPLLNLIPSSGHKSRV